MGFSFSPQLALVFFLYFLFGLLWSAVVFSIWFIAASNAASRDCCIVMATYLQFKGTTAMATITCNGGKIKKKLKSFLFYFSLLCCFFYVVFIKKKKKKRKKKTTIERYLSSLVVTFYCNLQNVYKKLNNYELEMLPG